MLESFSPFKFGALLAAILIGIFSVRFFIMSIQYYRIYNAIKEKVNKEPVEPVAPKQQNFFLDGNRLSAGDASDYNYPYSDENNYNFDYFQPTDPSITHTHPDEKLYILIKLYMYLTTIYWAVGLASQPFILYGIFGKSDICILIWLYAIALKIASTLKLLICLFLYVGETKEKLIFMWPHGDFPFVLFLVFLWFLVFFYFLESQRSFFMSTAQTVTMSQSISSSDTSIKSPEVEPTVAKLRHVKSSGDITQTY